MNIAQDDGDGSFEDKNEVDAGQGHPDFSGAAWPIPNDREVENTVGYRSSI
jgi:hypothetical protein